MNISKGSVKLTGRSIVETIPVDAVALADNIDHNVDLDLSAYQRVYFFAVSSLNQTVTFTLRMQATAYATHEWGGAAWAALPTIDHAGSSLRYLLNTRWTILDKPGLKNIRIVYKAAVAPSSGSVSLYLWGVPN